MDRKQIKLFILVAILVELTITVTYAYFAVNAVNDFETVRISASAEDIGSVALEGSSATLSINLSASDMMPKETDVTYYAANTGEPSENVYEAILGETNTTGDGYYNCSYTLTGTSKTGSSMYNTFQNMTNKSENQIKLNINEKSYDFNIANLFPITYYGSMNGITSTKKGIIKASLYIKNLKNVDQTELAGTSIQIDIKISDFNCTAVEKPATTREQILAISPENISGDLVGGLYRYQGSYEDVTNNYVCLGTTSKDTCTSDTDKYMYRILGITSEGNLKIIKNEGLNELYMWDLNSSEKTWNNSDLFLGLNGISGGAYNNIFMNNENFPYLQSISPWYDKIINYNWKYGEVTNTDSLVGDTVYQIENAWTNEVNGKVGLMNVSDYYYASDFNGEHNNTGWVNSRRTDPGRISLLEWVISKCNQNNICYITNPGKIGLAPITYSESNTGFLVRPVLYVSEGFNISGNGTDTNPYILNY